MRSLETDRDAMAEDLMHYDLLTLEALRGVVRRALQRVKKSGLPGEHHFYISFDTRHPGVVISERLRKNRDATMTIVLQHQFWNLTVESDRFEVDLSFNDVQERLVVPFAAVRSFFDPYAQFALQFETAEASAEKSPAPAAPRPDRRMPAKAAEAAEAEPPAAAAEPPPRQDDKVVVLDQFRKK